MEKLYVSYLRVSTARQGTSGLGLEAQRASVLSYIRHNGDKIVKEFVEVESGKNNKRPELLKAIEFAKQNNCILIVAKLDRLSRDLAFISALMASKVRFVAADMPQANSLTLHIISALAQYERELISSRTKSALDAKRVREPDWKPGTNNLTQEGRAKSRKAIINGANQNERNRHAYHYISQLKKEGHSYRDIASKLNAEGYKTRRGGTFAAAQVRNIWIRFKEN